MVIVPSIVEVTDPVKCMVSSKVNGGRVPPDFLISEVEKRTVLQGMLPSGVLGQFGSMVNPLELVVVSVNV